MQCLKAFIGSLICICLFTVQAMAQGPGDPGCDPLDPLCPIDGGVSLLIAAGIAIGAKKAYDSKKANSNDTANPF